MMKKKSIALDDVKFDLKPIDEKPSRRGFVKASKYDPILDAFMKGEDELVEVHVEGKEAYYLRLQLKKRIEARNLQGIEASVVNDVCYLDRT